MLIFEQNPDVTCFQIHHANRQDKFKNHRRSPSSSFEHRSKSKQNRLRSAIVKAKDRFGHSYKARRQSKIVSSAVNDAREYKSNQGSTLFKHIHPKIVNPLPLNIIPKHNIEITKAVITNQASISGTSPISDKHFVSIGTQTDPCKCSQRNKQKNKNRREAAKLNRDIVQHLVNSEVIQFKT